MCLVHVHDVFRTSVILVQAPSVYFVGANFVRGSSRGREYGTYRMYECIRNKYYWCMHDTTSLRYISHMLCSTMYVRVPYRRRSSRQQHASLSLYCCDPNTSKKHPPPAIMTPTQSSLYVGLRTCLQSGVSAPRPLPKTADALYTIL